MAFSRPGVGDQLGLLSSRCLPRCAFGVWCPQPIARPHPDAPMTLSRRAFLVAASAAAIAFAPSCNRDSGTSGNKIKVAFVTNNPEDFWTIAEKGANDAAAKHDVEVLFRRPEKGEAGIQLQIVR